MFFQLMFGSAYDRNEVVQKLEEVFERSKVRSCTISEICGIYDFVIRTWLPLGVSAPRFVLDLSNELRDSGCTRVLPFFVSKCAYHWAWSNSPSFSLLPADKDILAKIRAGEITQDEVSDPAKIEKFPRSAVIARPDLNTFAGVKFYILVSAPGGGGYVPPAARDEDVEKRLRILLGKLRDEGSIGHPSMYVGTGFASILIRGVVTTIEQFASIATVIDRINEISVQGWLGIRTYTYIATGQAVERETLTLPAANSHSRARPDPTGLHPEEDLDVERLLSGIEDDRFEVKGSLRLDLAQYFNDPKHLRIKNDALALEGALKTIVGFLNASGGRLLIGAIEKSKFARTKERFPDVFADLPEFGDWIVTGIDLEYALTKNFDGFLLQLVDLIKTHIGAEASALVTIVPLRYKNRDLMLVKVPQGINWYYLDDRFYIRRSGSTSPLAGKDLERYLVEVRRR